MEKAKPKTKLKPIEKKGLSQDVTAVAQALTAPVFVSATDAARGMAPNDTTGTNGIVAPGVSNISGHA